MEKRKQFFVELVKYGLVGIWNTLLTAIVIWIILGGHRSTASTGLMLIANISGYLVGVVNSFILNRNWTFKSNTDWKIGFVRFLIAFGICYVIQLGVVLWLNSFITNQAYLCQLAGIVVYSGLNFLLNKFYTFKTYSEPEKQMKE